MARYATTEKMFECDACRVRFSERESKTEKTITCPRCNWSMYDYQIQIDCEGRSIDEVYNDIGYITRTQMNVLRNTPLIITH